MKNNSAAAVAISESVAENLAGSFLTHYFGSDIFIGSDIEHILAEHASIIYQDVADPQYSGASISYKGVHFIALNTHQTLRARYYSAAHELWHLGVTSDVFGSEGDKYKKLVSLPVFNVERAADHFAAAVMLPKNVMTLTWATYVKNQAKPNIVTEQNAIIRIANMAAMPYEAVTRRLSELNLLLTTQLTKKSESEWQALVNRSSFPPSPLDVVEPFNKFAHYTQLINELVDKQQLTLLEAAQLSTYADPISAKNYLNQRQQLVDNLQGDHDE